VALEGQVVRSWIWDRLVADNGPGGVNTLCGGTPTTPGRIYQDLVPATAVLPAVTINLVSHVDALTLGGDRVFAVAALDVHVHGDGAGYGAINPIADRADAVLQGAGAVKAGVASYKLRRTDVRASVDTDAGKPYSHVIQSYTTEAEVVS
jgi:hypothetical protein